MGLWATPPGALSGLGLAYSHPSAPATGLGTNTEVSDKCDLDEPEIVLLTNV